jgi:hypothetical protein
MFLSDKVKIWDLLKGVMSLVEVRWHYEENESKKKIELSIHSNMHLEHSGFSLQS